MVGIVSTHEPIRGIMAKRIKEYLQQVTIAEKQGTVQRAQSPQKTNIKLVEIVNE